MKAPACGAVGALAQRGSRQREHRSSVGKADFRVLGTWDQRAAEMTSVECHREPPARHWGCSVDNCTCHLLIRGKMLSPQWWPQTKRDMLRGAGIFWIKKWARTKLPGNGAMERMNKISFQRNVFSYYYYFLIRLTTTKKLQLLRTTQHFKSSHAFQAYPAKQKLWFIWNLLINTGMALSPAVAQLLAWENFFFLKKKENILSWNSKVPLQMWSLPRQGRKGVKCGRFSLCLHWVPLSSVAQSDS